MHPQGLCPNVVRRRKVRESRLINNMWYILIFCSNMKTRNSVQVLRNINANVEISRMRAKCSNRSGAYLSNTSPILFFGITILRESTSALLVSKYFSKAPELMFDRQFARCENSSRAVFTRATSRGQQTGYIKKNIPHPQFINH